MVSLSLREGVCSGEHLLCQPGTPSLGPGRLVDTPGGGAWIHCQERRFGYLPLGLGPAQLWRASTAERVEGWSLLALGLSTPSWLSCWQSCCSHSSVTSPGMWVMEGGAEQKHVLGSCPSQRRSHLQACKPQDNCWLPASSWVGWEAGHSRDRSIFKFSLFLFAPSCLQPIPFVCPGVGERERSDMWVDRLGSASCLAPKLSPPDSVTPKHLGRGGSPPFIHLT